MNSNQKAFLYEIADIRFSVLEKLGDFSRAASVKWVTSACLLTNNVMLAPAQDDKYAPLNSALIQQDDILVKRISPTFINYVDFTPTDFYAANNIIRIRPNQQIITPKYLAYYLEAHLNEMIAAAAKGTVMPTLSRMEINNALIDLPPIYIQRAVGEIWYLSTKRQRLLQQLYLLEQKKINYQLLTVTKHGGKI